MRRSEDNSAGEIINRLRNDARPVDRIYAGEANAFTEWRITKETLENILRVVEGALQRDDVDVVFGEAFRLPAPADPLSRAAIVDVAESLRQRLADHVTTARARTGRVAVDDPSAPRKDGAP